MALGLLRGDLPNARRHLSRRGLDVLHDALVVLDDGLLRERERRGLDLGGEPDDVEDLLRRGVLFHGGAPGLLRRGYLRPHGAALLHVTSERAARRRLLEQVHECDGGGGGAAPLARAAARARLVQQEHARLRDRALEVTIVKLHIDRVERPIPRDDGAGKERRLALPRRGDRGADVEGVRRGRCVDGRVGGRAREHGVDLRLHLAPSRFELLDVALERRSAPRERRERSAHIGDRVGTDAFRPDRVRLQLAHAAEDVQLCVGYRKCAGRVRVSTRRLWSE